MYDISTRDSAATTLKRILQVNDIRKEWYLNGLETDQLIKKHKKQIQDWDLTKEEFLVKHVTFSIDRLEDIKKYGLLSLSDVLTKDTSLKKVLHENDIHFDIQNEMLVVCGQYYDLNQTRRGEYNNDLFQIYRAIKHDYLSTMLYNEHPWEYSSFILNHPEFMMYLERIDNKCKAFVEWWAKNSVGYMITARVPFEDVYYETYGFKKEEEDYFIYDSKHKYLKSKEYLVSCAISALLCSSKGVYLFIDRNKSIKPEQFTKVEEKDLRRIE